jgi:uncharacterized protein (DUF488 family)
MLLSRCETQMKTGSLSSDRLYTVGHSVLTLEAFLALLRGAGVGAIADVRSAPYSRRLPQFNRDELRNALRQAGVEYVFLGEQLGGRPRDRSLYDVQGRVDYEAVRRTAAFREGLERLQEGAGRYVVALLCGEEDPLDCHRGLMITPALVERGVAPLHLRKGGAVETTPEMEERLLDMTGLREKLEQPELFAPRPERGAVLAEAYRRRAARAAFQIEEEQSA